MSCRLFCKGGEVKSLMIKVESSVQRRAESIVGLDLGEMS